MSRQFKFNAMFLLRNTLLWPAQGAALLEFLAQAARLQKSLFRFLVHDKETDTEIGCLGTALLNVFQNGIDKLQGTCGDHATLRMHAALILLVREYVRLAPNAENGDLAKDAAELFNLCYERLVVLHCKNRSELFLRASSALRAEFLSA